MKNFCYGLHVSEGDIFDSCPVGSTLHALVNPANKAGSMGAGLALEFKNRWPAYYADYLRFLERQGFSKKALHTWRDDAGLILITLPTKIHYRNPSNMDLIRAGLEELSEFCFDNDVTSLSVPALGCGLGGLLWKDVKPEIIRQLRSLSEVCHINLFEPK